MERTIHLELVLLHIILGLDPLDVVLAHQLPITLQVRVSKSPYPAIVSSIVCNDPTVFLSTIIVRMSHDLILTLVSSLRIILILVLLIYGEPKVQQLLI